MRRREALLPIVLGLLAAMTLAAGGIGSPTQVTVSAADLDPYVGKRLEARVVDVANGEEVLRLLVTSIPAARLDLLLEPLEAGVAYRVDLFVDANEDGWYDAPPVDAAWRIELRTLAEPSAVPLSGGDPQLDIDWPPAAGGAVAQDEYRHVLVDSRTGIVLFWQNDAATLYVGLVSPGSGWVAVGFGATNRMQGANIVIGAVTDGILTLQDEFGTGAMSHREDEASSILQRGGQELDGKTIIEFALPLATGQTDDVDLTPGAKVTAILAFHASSDDLGARHTSRSTVQITLD